MSLVSEIESLARHFKSLGRTFHVRRQRGADAEAMLAEPNIRFLGNTGLACEMVLEFEVRCSAIGCIRGVGVLSAPFVGKRPTAVGSPNERNS
jgi:hypothetical protein